MAEAQVPDVLWGPWTPQHSKDLYFNPESDELEAIRLSIDITAEELALRDKLMPYWFAKATVFLYEDSRIPAACTVVRVHGLEEPPTVIRWGLVGDEENWARAVYYNGAWRYLLPHERWSFGYALSEDGKRLESAYLFINGEIVADF